MKKIVRVLSPAALLLIASVSAQAAPYGIPDFQVDDFQVTGNVTEKTANSITVMKGKERFQIAIHTDTKMAGDVKVGSKVTIKYKMHASSIESKDAAPAPAKTPKPAKAK